MSHWIIAPVVLPALVAPFIVAAARHDMLLQRVIGIAACTALLAVAIGQAFIAGRFGDVHALGTPPFQKRTSRESFEASWRATLGDRVLTGFTITDAGHIDLAYVPGLEEVSQKDFVGFAQITFSTPEIKLEDDRAFAIAAVMLDHDGKIRLGALHAR